MMMPVPSLILSVCAPMYASAIAGSSIGWSAGTGDGGTCGSGRITCSPVQRLSNPACSAARATAAAVLGNAQAPLLIPNSANFMERRIARTVCRRYREAWSVPATDVDSRRRTENRDPERLAWPKLAALVELAHDAPLGAERYNKPAAVQHAMKL